MERPALLVYLSCFQEAGSIFEAMTVLALYLPEKIHDQSTESSESTRE
jgi:hypothetical protein